MFATPCFISTSPAQTPPRPTFEDPNDINDPHGFFERERLRELADLDHDFQKQLRQRGPSPPKLTPAERLALRNYPPFRWDPTMRLPSPGMEESPVRQLIESCFPTAGTWARFRHKYPDADMSQLRGSQWFDLVDRPEELAGVAQRAAARSLRFKFGITSNPVHRWGNLMLGISYSKMVAAPTRSSNVSAAHECALIRQFRDHPNCDNVMPGGEGQSDSMPHWVYCSIRRTGPLRAPPANIQQDS